MRVAIVGAGLAGLACGCELAERGHRVTLFERRPWCGGKACSFVDPDTGERIDNGQHIFMRCTTAYIDFLRRIGTPHLARLQPRLRVPVFDAQGRSAVLSASALPAPLHLLPSFLRYRHLTRLDRARVARAVVAMGTIPRERRHEYDHLTFAQWLRQHSQTETAIRGFWDLVIVAALNCRSDHASAAQGLFVLREGVLASHDSAAIGLPLASLEELHVTPAVRFIETRKGEVRTRARVEAVDVAADRFKAIVDADGTRHEFDACVIALPPRASSALLPPMWRALPPFDALQAFQPSPIVNLHLWFDGPVADFEFAAFTGCDLQWIFNRTRIAGHPARGREHLVLSLSAARAFIELDKEALVSRLLPQLAAALPAVRERQLLRAAAIKEAEATFTPAPRIVRPGNITPIRNLFLAGAYTDTGWPATMESAVRSGLAAAAAVIGQPGARESTAVALA
jgi:squalene-associated FAD-dependent desaturase